MRRFPLFTAVLAATIFGAFLAFVALGPWWLVKGVILTVVITFGLLVVGIGTYYFFKDA